MIKQILDIFKSPKAQRNILIVALVAAIIFLRGCGEGSEIDVIKYEQNIAALQDSVRTYKTKNGDLVYEKMALIANEKELGKYNQELVDEVKYLKDNPIVITKFVTRIVHDTVWLKPTIDSSGIAWNSDSTIITIPFNWKDSTYYNENNYKILKGQYTVNVDTALNVSSDFKITQNELGISFTTGLTESDDDKVEIYITSDYPGFVPTDITGALIDPRESDVIKKFFPPKRWALGVYGGYGFYLDPINARVGSGIQVGIGLQYNIIQWHGKKK